MIHNVDYHITDKCNLNCAACNHFCPLVPADTEHKSMEQIEKDLTALSKFRDHIKKVTILGGEPTLHPNFTEILYLTRKLFPKNLLEVTTNGTTYKKIGIFKKAILDNNFHMILSIYPYKENYMEGYNEIIKEFEGTDIVYQLKTPTFLTSPLTLTRKNTDDKILNCRMRGTCCQLKDEHLYICNLAAQSNYLYDAFPFLKNYIFKEGYEKISLIDEHTTIGDIEAMVYNSIPAFCFYCHECNRNVIMSIEEFEKSGMSPQDGDFLERMYDKSEYAKWKKSEKKIDEWVR